MSFGSRATQAKPEALSSCSEQLPETASFLRVTAGLCPHARGFLNYFLRESFFALWTGLRAGAHPALYLCCARE
jgi:hypothetical protein